MESAVQGSNITRQECIPVGCVPPAAVAVPGGSPPGTLPLGADPPGAGTPLGDLLQGMLGYHLQWVLG